jgi:hypothetical protein
MNYILTNKDNLEVHAERTDSGKWYFEEKDDIDFKVGEILVTDSPYKFNKQKVVGLGKTFKRYKTIEFENTDEGLIEGEYSWVRRIYIETVKE